MAILEIEKGAENPVLRTVSKPVKKSEIRKLGKFLDNMRETMFSANGIGLAAPQVSRNIRAVICYFNYDTPNELIVEMVNPVILSRSRAKESHEEGCLSLPGKFGQTPRHTWVTVRFLDRKGAEHVLKLSGLNARIVQHELDHIDGMLYIDRAMS